MDIRSLEKEFLGKQIRELQRKFGAPQSVHMVTDKDYNVTKKLLYDKFSVMTKNNVCEGFSRRFQSKK